MLKTTINDIKIVTVLGKKNNHIYSLSGVESCSPNLSTDVLLIMHGKMHCCTSGLRFVVKTFPLTIGINSVILKAKYSNKQIDFNATFKM